MQYLPKCPELVAAGSPSEMIASTEVWLRLRFLWGGAPNLSYTVTQFGRSSSAATDNVFDFRAHPVLDFDVDGRSGAWERGV